VGNHEKLPGKDLMSSLYVGGRITKKGHVKGPKRGKTGRNGLPEGERRMITRASTGRGTQGDQTYKEVISNLRCECGGEETKVADQRDRTNQRNRTGWGEKREGAGWWRRGTCPRMIPEYKAAHNTLGMRARGGRIRRRHGGGE